ncbi:MAG TPA: OmpA family protein [Rhabdochlamydiaceae bacterium]|jgi:peptidoglycan-associated lipoprotein
MKTRQILIICTYALTCFLMTGCKSKKNGTVWDDNSHTTGGYKNTARNLWNNMVGNNQEDPSFFGPTEEDFIALNDDDLKKSTFMDGAIPQPKTEPGDRNSGIPGIEGFKKPSGELAGIFKQLHFNTDDHILRAKEELALIERIADYLKSHRDCYLFIEGHADERGPEAYNLALGSRRSNYVRSLLVQKGVDSERVHTVSYGKERPVDLGHGPDAWSKNRRAEFRIFQKS